MITLGLKPAGHDSTAVIVRDGEVLAASAEERFDREKHSGAFPRQAIEYVLSVAGVEIDSVDSVDVVFKYWKLFAYLHVWGFLRFFPRHTASSFRDGAYQLRKIRRIKRALRDLGYSGPVNFRDHHDCHAAAVYFASRLERPAVLTVDGRGERACTRIYRSKGGQLKTVFEQRFPDSLGLFYAAITQYLGFKPDEDEGKVMGLAPYGTAQVVEKMRNVLDGRSHRSYSVNLAYFEMQYDPRRGVSPRFAQEFGEPREVNAEITQRHKDVAFAAQALLEEAMGNLVRLAKELTGSDSLCISGGVALNSVSVGKVLASGIFENVYVYPASGDDGAAVGAALLGCIEASVAPVSDLQDPYLGKESTEAEILAALEAASGVTFRRTDHPGREAATLIANGKICAWYQGRAEFGPRALGNRSILVDPRKAEHKDLLNARVKFREAFRPFAPSVLFERAEEYFATLGRLDRYMSAAYEVIENKRNVIPAVTHVDGTARVQTVRKGDNPAFYKLIEEFERLSGVPLVLNTSFNRMGEPIVNSPEQAVVCLLESGLDALVIGPYVVMKSPTRETPA